MTTSFFNAEVQTKDGQKVRTVQPLAVNARWLLAFNISDRNQAVGYCLDHQVIFDKAKSCPECVK